MRLRLLLFTLLLPCTLWAAQVEMFTPTGEVRDVRQISARFSAPMVNFGDPRLADPFVIDCPASGHGRWVDARNWAFDLDADLPAGLRCRLQLHPELRTLDGEVITGPREFEFSTGGPAVRASLPDSGELIDAEQLFLLALDAPASADTVRVHAACQVPHLAEALKVEVVEGELREAVLAQRRLLGYAYYRLLFADGDTAFAQLEYDALQRFERNIVVVRCARPLPDDSEVELIWGAGIASASGVATQTAQRFGFKTRKAFTAQLSCSRVNANAACVPVLPLTLEFSAPVPAAWARQVSLHGPEGRREPQPPGDDPVVEILRFDPPFAESADYRVELPAGLRDDAGRGLQNASSFPLRFATDAAPPLAKFSGDFGILELAEGGVLPLSLRDVEAPLPALVLGGQRRRITDETDIYAWMQRVRRAQQGNWDHGDYRPPGIDSVFADTADEALAIPLQIERPAGGKAFEVIGIPLQEPGFHVVELASPRLGAALLGEARPRYVATSALVTNMAVHFHWGRERSLVFVSTLDSAAPVADAVLRVVDVCSGETLWSGRSDSDGLARLDTGVPKPSSYTHCSDNDRHPLMVSARKADDFSFVLTDWDQGITPYDFGLHSGLWERPEIGHSVLDRSLLRAGETVAMKHYWRRHVGSGLALAADTAPDTLVIEHGGSGEQVELPLRFDAQGIAESQWSIPRDARLGEYTLRLKRADAEERQDYGRVSGRFRVEEYRIPLMQAQLTLPEQATVAGAALPVKLYVGYFSGGGAGGLPVTLRSRSEPRSLQFAAYPGFSFNSAPVSPGIRELEGGGYFADDEAASAATDPARSQPLLLDADGSARIDVELPPLSGQARSLVMELEYPDANGELTNLRAQHTLWPAEVLAGLRIDGWLAQADDVRAQIVVLDLQGRPLAGRKVEVGSYLRIARSYRKRLVGGFYTYSNSSEIRPLPTRCSGRTDANGMVFCNFAPGVGGEIVLEAVARDDAGRASHAVASAWLAGDDDLWFAQGNSDRMDLVPEQRELEPGQTLRLQVRMPFRRATALVSVQREGVIDAFVTELSGENPVIEVPIKPEYAPNIYVSVLALRPRVGGFASRLADFLRRSGLDRWIPADGGSPGPWVDLSRPAWRMGLTQVDVGWNAHRLEVQVRPEHSQYAIRERATVDIEVRSADGSALPANAEIAFAAVDEALLDLQPNPSVALLDAMMQRRDIEVLSSTAQMQVVGKRHYGRKALAPGGGGGRGAPRELLNSLLLWQGRVALDANGHARIQVPLNDALSRFRLTAVASAGADRFGTGSASIVTTQDFQLLSGLPPLVRENDRYRAVFTVRNTTEAAARLRLEAELSADNQAPRQTLTQTVDVAAGAAAPVAFDVEPAGTAQQLQWSLRLLKSDGATVDALNIRQQVLNATPVRVYQATLSQLDAPLTLAVQRPAEAIEGRGELRVQLQDSLVASLSGVREYMADYPYSCLEQQASRAIALGDTALWDTQMTELGRHLDDDGLLRYFPSPWLEGSDTLTAYLLNIATVAQRPVPESARNRMLDGLDAMVEGRIERGNPLAYADQTERKLAALLALSRHGRPRPEALAALQFDPALLPTSALLDWIELLHQLPQLDQAAARRNHAKTLLRARLNLQATHMGFANESDDALWWLMISADVNANRAVLALMDDADWAADLPRMVRGAVGRQQRGHWNLTTANAWGVLALQHFAERHETTAVSGDTLASLGAQQQQHRWSDGRAASLDLPWPAATAQLQIEHHGSGAPWAIVQSRAALPLREALSSGYRLQRSIDPVQQRVPGEWHVGDVARVRLHIDAQSDMSWVVVEDPIPAGASLLGGGLGRDSALLAAGAQQQGAAALAFEERRFDVYRAYYAYVPKGEFAIEYTLRYNSAGQFELPTTRVEAMYAPEMFGELPNGAVAVAP